MGEEKLHAATVVWFLPDDAVSGAAPLILRRVLFCPLITWTCAALTERGAERLLLVADARVHESLRPHAPERAVFVDGARHAEELLALLGGETGRLLVLHGAVLPVGVFSGGAAYTADAEAVCAVLRERGSYADAPAHAAAESGFLPVGSAEELREALPVCRREILRRHEDAGVEILDEANCYLDPRVRIGAGSVLLPGTILRGETSVGRDCVIGPNTMLTDCAVGDETEVNASQCTKSVIGSHTTVGPFAYLRPGSRVGDHVKVGDFVEVKNSVVGSGTKISHLTYVGDSDVGERVNFGCGTVTTNYDGFRKYRCVIGDDAFIGCNTNLVAPVRVGRGSYTAAGSTITADVPEDALGVARARQSNINGWAARNRAIKGKKK